MRNQPTQSEISHDGHSHQPLPNLRPAPFLTSGQLSRETGLPQSRIQELVPEGLPAYQLDQRRYVYDRDEAIAWLVEHGHLLDPYRAAIKRWSMKPHP